MLSIVPTPIGNLKDITLRALETLKAADVIACEDTRHTKKLTLHFEIETKLISFHDHSSPVKLKELIEMLEEGRHVALVSDAGTPLISDPGFPLVRAAIQKDIQVEVLPGACALTAALSASGLPSEAFSFFGFLPSKLAGRKKKLQNLEPREETLIFYESPYRIQKTILNIQEVLGDRELVIARELTKKFEEIIRGKVSEVIEKISGRSIKGEIVLLVAGKNRKPVFTS